VPAKTKETKSGLLASGIVKIVRTPDQINPDDMRAATSWSHKADRRWDFSPVWTGHIGPGSEYYERRLAANLRRTKVPREGAWDWMAEQKRLNAAARKLDTQITRLAKGCELPCEENGYKTVPYAAFTGDEWQDDALDGIYLDDLVEA